MIICIVGFYSMSFAQTFIMPLWPDKIPNYTETNEFELRDTTDVMRITNVKKPDIAVFLPSKRSETGQAVVICPGGGYQRLAYEWAGTDVAKWLNSKGIVAVLLKYRLPGSKSNIIRYKSPLFDAERAIRLTRYHAKGWNIDKVKIGIMGSSAGGHVASTLLTRFGTEKSGVDDDVEKISSRPDFAILLYPVITFTYPYCNEISRESLIGKNPDSSLVEYYSNELHVRDDTPPTFIVHATDDKTVPVENSLLFYEALKQKNIPVEMHIYAKGGHGFSLAIGKEYLQTWTDRCIDWLRSLK